MMRHVGASVRESLPAIGNVSHMACHFASIASMKQIFDKFAFVSHFCICFVTNRHFVRLFVHAFLHLIQMTRNPQLPKPGNCGFLWFQGRGARP